MGEKVKLALSQAFKNAYIEIDPFRNDRYSGLIVLEGFAADDEVERQQKVRKLL